MSVMISTRISRKGVHLSINKELDSGNEKPKNAKVFNEMLTKLKLLGWRAQSGNDTSEMTQNMCTLNNENPTVL